MVPRKSACIRAVLRKAREVKDPLAEYAAAVRPCSGNAQLVQVRSYHARDMPKELQEWCLATCRENMAALYDRVWTWSDTKKRKQLTSAASRFLIAHDAGAGRAPLAYVNYRFEEDEGHAVLYCYELQVTPAAQSRGLGRMLMELAERIAWGAGMSKLVLTVFCENTAAVAFYLKLGYDLDETSPDYCHGSSTSSGARIGGSGSEGSSCMGGTGGGGSTAAGGSDGSGSGSGGRSCASSFTGGSGSQADSAGAGCGYHILSKRAPAGGAQQGQPERQAAAVGQPEQQCVGDAERQEGQAQGEAREAPSGRQDTAPLLQPESNKRPRTDASGAQRMRLSEGSGEGVAAAGGCGGGTAAAATAPHSQPGAPSSLPAEQQGDGKEAGWRDAAREEVEQVKPQSLDDAMREPQQPEQPTAQQSEQPTDQQSEQSRQPQGQLPSVAKEQQQLAQGAEQRNSEQHPWSDQPVQRGQPEQQQQRQRQDSLEQQEMRQQQQQQGDPHKEPQWQRATAQSLPASVAATSPEPEAEGDAAGVAGCVELPGLSPPARHAEVDAGPGARGERWACEEIGWRPPAAAKVEADTAMVEAEPGVGLTG
ncbi:hypothetical protein PLESTF_000733200 [Pleodorina starrii]|nr:hypothetical protein PLESTF_000733200 [Pleodorina starrii]